MPLIIITTMGKKIEIRGELKDLRKWKPGRFIEAVDMAGLKIAVNPEHVLVVRWISDELFAAQIAEAQRQQEEAAKLNPHPGREPERRIPGGRR